MAEDKMARNPSRKIQRTFLIMPHVLHERQDENTKSAPSYRGKTKNKDMDETAGNDAGGTLRTDLPFYLPGTS